MSLTVFFVVLLGAALHASWNAIVKVGGDKLLTTVLMATLSALLAVPILPFLPAMHPDAYPWLAISTAIHVVYFLLVANSYRLADMSRTYPLMRGTAPLLVALVGLVFLGERLSEFAWAGILVICTGILSMVVGRMGGQGKGIGLAALNSVVICGYTLVDGAGVRASGSPIAYTLWLALTSVVPLLIYILATRRREFITYAGKNWRPCLVAAIGTTTSYGLALWAMTKAPIAVVAALRETSIFFALLISVFLLGEKPGRLRIASAAAICCGAMLLRLA